MTRTRPLVVSIVGRLSGFGGSALHFRTVHVGPAVGQWAQNLVVRGGCQWERRGDVASGSPLPDSLPVHRRSGCASWGFELLSSLKPNDLAADTRPTVPSAWREKPLVNVANHDDDGPGEEEGRGAAQMMCFSI